MMVMKATKIKEKTLLETLNGLWYYAEVRERE